MNITRNAWRYTLQQTGLRDMMSPSDREKLDKSLESGDPPPFTEETLFAAFRSAEVDPQTMLLQGHRTEPATDLPEPQEEPEPETVEA